LVSQKTSFPPIQYIGILSFIIEYIFYQWRSQDYEGRGYKYKLNQIFYSFILHLLWGGGGGGFFLIKTKKKQIVSVNAK